ncbi:Permuted papain-like amidase enzyme, YaeF/YiiX, C92 family [Roseivivax lentus]|uniref:Permuted papain-like amidase enzyme, YaeF/YiiX, C92 family n=1 Tax=Roseivivax lentus TaxID=633194 RepID=A0A1N7JRY5_9RHOB|nr:lipo-like protein [Roseivivax lentus]SIS52067.1 Permuted papain-like amidase enzyme, YaeF/YiiX, C92 family [Roseivivax lentus]
MDKFLSSIGARMARWLAERRRDTDWSVPSDFDRLRRTLRPGDVLLVEGQAHVSVAIKYLTQSTWSHAALYTGPIPGRTEPDGTPHELVEAVVEAGCISVPLSKYADYHTRICRPVGLSRRDRQRVVDFMIGKIGLSYDLRNIFDLLRYFIPTPPFPVPWRRRMLSLGSGDPTRAICSSLIAQAFQSVQYPILPRIETLAGTHAAREILHIRHHSLFAPRDFDISPFFEIVKPHLAQGFDPGLVEWATTPAEGAARMQ